MKDFSAFLNMRRYLTIIPVLPVFLRSQSASFLLSILISFQRVLKVSRYSSTWFTLVEVDGKCWWQMPKFVVDKISVSQLLQKALNVFLGTFSTFNLAFYSSALALISCCMELKGSVRSESLGPSKVFPEHTHSPGHVHGLLESRRYVSSFQSS